MWSIPILGRNVGKTNSLLGVCDECEKNAVEKKCSKSTYDF
jgi:hypothetical protein